MQAAVLNMPPQKKPKGRPKSAVQRRTIIALKGTPEFAAWLADFATFARLSQADAVEHGLVCLAREKGFREPPLR
jgi:hypothetical protein